MLRRLSSVSISEGSAQRSLEKLVDLCRETFSARFCIIVIFDNPQVYRSMSDDLSGLEECTWPCGPLRIDFLGSDHLDESLLSLGVLVEKYGLDKNGQGVASVAAAIRFGFNAMMAAPITSDAQLLGFIAVFRASTACFSVTEKELLSLFAEHTIIPLEREIRRQLESTFQVLNDLTRSLTSSSTARFLKCIAESVCTLLHVDTCVIWEYDSQSHLLRVAGCTSNVNDEYESFTLSEDDARVRVKLTEGVVWQTRDVIAEDADCVGKEPARAHKWASLLSTPMHVGGRLAGLLEVSTQSPRTFLKWEKEVFQAFANEVALSLHQLQSRVAELDGVLKELDGVHNERELFRLALKSALRVVGVSRGWIGKLNILKGTCDIWEQAEERDQRIRALNESFDGEKLIYNSARRIDDARKHQDCCACWSDTRSILTVPLIIENAEIRVGRTVEFGKKQIGVLVVESPQAGAFFNLDEVRLSTIARATANAYERIDTDRKYASLNRIETEILALGMSVQETVDRILQGIQDTLGFSFVNISEVTDDGRIRSEYLAGLSVSQAARFRRMADHPLVGDKLGIQADILRLREIDVPAIDDPRFDWEIFREFNQQNLVRVFVPMITSAGSRIVGTVEAGYPRKLRPNIYERDAKVLSSFVTFVTEVLEQKREEVLETIMHELRAPVAAIRSNVSFLQRRSDELPSRLSQRKLADLALDAELVLLQVSKIERFLGGSAPESSIQRTVVFRDIIIKSVNQVKPKILEAGFDLARVRYNSQDAGRMVLYLDSAKVSQVVLNLLINAIKYAHKDPSRFAIQIEMDENASQFVVMFKDWGIGINAEYEDRIFERGFRTPEARASFVTGSGLGLNIAGNIMRELGGDLKLAHRRNPTEFHMILPKALKERPNDLGS